MLLIEPPRVRYKIIVKSTMTPRRLQTDRRRGARIVNRFYTPPPESVGTLNQPRVVTRKI